jgi:ABC-2 type transport system permease protein
MATYSNVRALKALCKASLRSMLKSPSAVFFSIAFPLIFILVFGFLGNNQETGFTITFDEHTDTTSLLYEKIHHSPSIHVRSFSAIQDKVQALSEGSLDAVISLREQAPGVLPHYDIKIESSVLQLEQMELLQALLIQIASAQHPEIAKHVQSLVNIDLQIIPSLRPYKAIDFILPGQLGFSLLATGVFGTAFVFFNLRQTLVLKRFFATPVRREIIILSEGISRMFFQISGAIIIIGIGYFCFDFTLIHTWVTFLQMLVLCGISLMIFMGFGFIISGLAKNEATIPPLSNLITLPQFLLAGTFFPVEKFPIWLQPICQFLPLTWLNDGLRKIAYDGLNLWDLGWHWLVLLTWGILVYGIASRVFKWE